MRPSYLGSKWYLLSSSLWSGLIIIFEKFIKYTKYIWLFFKFSEESSSHVRFYATGTGWIIAEERWWSYGRGWNWQTLVEGQEFTIAGIWTLPCKLCEVNVKSELCRTGRKRTSIVIKSDASVKHEVLDYVYVGTLAHWLFLDAQCLS